MNLWLRSKQLNPEQPENLCQQHHHGAVTLRGPVKTAEEKTKIDQLAKSAAPGAKIDDQLEVKGSK